MQLNKKINFAATIIFLDRLNQTDKKWLPVSVKEMQQIGWEQPDVILFSGDAYVDHPAFGAAVIGRTLEAEGLKVVIVPQPNWQDDLRDFRKFGTPRLFFAVSAGNMDSMVNHYTANRRRRSDDAYTPGGKAGMRPDYAASVYTKILKELYPDVPVVLGGIEASLRRLTHYDYWQDELKPGIMAWSGADLLIYGMGEQPLRELVRLLGRGVPFASLTTLAQTVVMQSAAQPLPAHKKWITIELNSHEACLDDKLKYAANFKHIEQESNSLNAARLTQRWQEQVMIVNPPYPPVAERELDRSYDLPYTRLPHPKYRNKGPIPAYEMIKHSIILHRGCFGGCSFCTISAHQGKFISSRSVASIVREAEQVTQMDDFKGYLSDLGGPSANMYRMQGRDLNLCKPCKRPSCIFPSVCSNLNTSHEALLEVYQKVDALPGMKKSFVGSGIRYDMLLNDKASEAEKQSHQRYLRELIQKHVSGRLKVAPEHTSDQVLKVMRKPSFSLFKAFKKEFERINTAGGLKQQLIPYFISSHPASGEKEMAELAVETKQLNFNLEQVQDFTPTPMTVATVIYYSGHHPYTLKPVYTARTRDEKQNQWAFFFWHQREKQEQIRKTLIKNGLEHLVPVLLEGRGDPKTQQQVKRANKATPRSGGSSSRKQNPKGENKFSGTKNREDFRKRRK